MNPPATQPNPIPNREQETSIFQMQIIQSHDEDGAIQLGAAERSPA